MYRAHAAHLLAIAFVIYLVAAIIAAILGLIGVFGALLGSIVVFIALFLVQASLVKAVQDVRDGQVDLSIGQTMSAATPSLGAVIGAGVLAGIAITIGLILLIAPGLFLITIWAVIVPAIVIERAGVFASFGRSQQLVRGYGWQVFGTLVLLWLILLVVDIILGLIFSPLHSSALRSGLSTVVSGTLIAPYIALVVTLMYYRLAAAHAGGPVPGVPVAEEPPWPTSAGPSPGPGPAAAGPGGWPAPESPSPGAEPAAEGPGAGPGPAPEPMDEGPGAGPGPAPEPTDEGPGAGPGPAPEPTDEGPGLGPAAEGPGAEPTAEGPSAGPVA
jgi:hypothetical protein